MRRLFNGRSWKDSAARALRSWRVTVSVTCSRLMGGGGVPGEDTVFAVTRAMTGTDSFHVLTVTRINTQDVLVAAYEFVSTRGCNSSRITYNIRAKTLRIDCHRVKPSGLAANRCFFSSRVFRSLSTKTRFQTGSAEIFYYYRWTSICQKNVRFYIRTV